MGLVWLMSAVTETLRIVMMVEWEWTGWVANTCVYTERDSRKDEAVVFIFIFATAGLLIWAAVKPWVGRWVEVSFLSDNPKY